MNLEQLVYIPNHIAPGVYIRVLDEIYPDVSHPEKYNALFFIASEYGPANQLVPITTEEQFLKTFGVAPNTYPWSSIMAQNHSKYATAYVIRLLPYDAKEANMVIALVPLLAKDVKLNNTLKAYIENSLNIDVDTMNDLDIIKYDSNTPILVLKVGNILDNNFISIPYNNNDTPVNYTVISNTTSSIDIDNRYAIPLFKFSGLGEYYNKLKIGFRFNVNKTFDLVIYQNIGNNIDIVVATIPNRSLLDQTDEYGVNLKLESGKQYGGVLYTVDEIHLNNVLTDTYFPDGSKIIISDFVDTEYVYKIIDYYDLPNYQATEHLKSILNLTDKISLKYGSDGSLKTPAGNFRFDVFASMVSDALYGKSRLTGQQNSYMAEPIYDLLDEELFIKYIYDPTDKRFSIMDRNKVHIALNDYAKGRYFNNSGAMVIANLAPIQNPMDKSELDNIQILRSELFTAYISEFEGVVNGVYYDNWPHIQLIARDLIIYRSQKGMEDSFAGAIAAQHTGVKNIKRKYTLAERDVLTLRGLNFLVKDVRYGTYTDLARTTYPFNSALRWAYVVEDLIDIKYELKMALKPYLHKLETYNWDTLIKRIDSMVFKPRRNRGLLTEYDIKLVKDEAYILQNILPIVISVRYARSMERISVTLYVK